MIDQNIDEAKKMLPALVGRKTAPLTRTQAASAVIESLSENYVDSILSPVFYYLVFAPAGLGLEAALAFKAISTMDSMIGYKTPGLRELGYAGAKLDDLANFIPARLSIILIALAWPAKASSGPEGGLPVSQRHAQPQLRLAHGRLRWSPGHPPGEARLLCAPERRKGTGHIGCAPRPPAYESRHCIDTGGSAGDPLALDTYLQVRRTLEDCEG